MFSATYMGRDLQDGTSKSRTVHISIYKKAEGSFVMYLSSTVRQDKLTVCLLGRHLTFPTIRSIYRPSINVKNFATMTIFPFRTEARIDPMGIPETSSVEHSNLKANKL